MPPSPNLLGYGVLGAFAIAGVWALTADAKPKQETTKLRNMHRNIKGLPGSNRVKWDIDKAGMLAPYIDGQVVGLPNAGPSDSQANLELTRQAVTIVRDGFAKRRTALPKDASPFTIDKYSKGLYPLDAFFRKPPEQVTQQDIQSSIQAPVDEFGRMKPGQYGSGGGMFGSIVALTKNPLFKVAVAVAVTAFGGPAGVAAYGAYNMWAERGADILSDPKALALQAARSYAVSQCGEVCGMAFDFGVGVAAGDSVDEAAEKALVNQMSPEERAYYEQGKETLATSGIKL